MKNHPLFLQNFIEQAIIETCKNISASNDSELKSLLIKINTTLIEIVKQEWPHNWPEFLPNIIKYAQVSESVCINVVSLLRIFR